MSAELRGQWCFGALGGEWNDCGIYGSVFHGFTPLFASAMATTLEFSFSLLACNGNTCLTLHTPTNREQKVLMTIFSCYFYWGHFVLLLEIWVSFQLQYFIWNAECIWRCIWYKLGTLILGEIYLLILCCNILGERLLKAEKEKCGRYFESEWLPSCRSGRLIPSSLPGITNNSTVSQNIFHQTFSRQIMFTKISKVLPIFLVITCYGKSGSLIPSYPPSNFQKIVLPK